MARKRSSRKRNSPLEPEASKINFINRLIDKGKIDVNKCTAEYIAEDQFKIFISETVKKMDRHHYLRITRLLKLTEYSDLQKEHHVTEWVLSELEKRAKERI